MVWSFEKLYFKQTQEQITLRTSLGMKLASETRNYQRQGENNFTEASFNVTSKRWDNFGKEYSNRLEQTSAAKICIEDK